MFIVKLGEFWNCLKPLVQKILDFIKNGPIWIDLEEGVSKRSPCTLLNGRGGHENQFWAIISEFSKVMGCWAERLSASMQPAGLKIWTSSNYQKFPEAQWEQQWMDPQWVPDPPWATMWDNAEVYNLVVYQCRVISCEKRAIPKYNNMSTNWGVGSNLKIFWPPNRNRNTTTCQQIKIWAAMWNFCGHHRLPAPRKQQSAEGNTPPQLPKSPTSR